LAFDESAEVRSQESQRTGVDHIEAEPAAETDLENDLFEISGNLE
jgi:hypothetical protein